MSNFIPISNFLCRCNNKIMPQTYDDSLSFQELIYQTINKLNECINNVNSWTELANKLDDSLKDFDEKVKNEVTVVIQAMYDSGELERIIKEVIEVNPVDNEASVLDFSRIARTIAVSNPHNDTSFTTDNFGFPQGATTFKIGAIRYWVVAFVHDNDFNGDTVRINAYQQVTDNRLQMIGSVVYDGLGHANGMSFGRILPNGFTVLVTPGSGELLNNVVELTFNTTTNSWNTQTETKTIVNPDINYCACITKYNDSWYILANNSNIYEYDFITNEVKTLVCHLPFNANISNAGIALTSENIFVADSINTTITKCKLDGSIVNVFKVPRVANGGNNLFGEIENIIVEDDICYCVTGYTLNPKYYNNYINVQFWKQNLKTKEIKPTNNINGAALRNTLYVDGAIPSVLDDATNPSGLTRADCFNCIQEALDYGKWNDAFKTIRVNIYQPLNLATIWVDCNKQIFLNGEGFYAEHSQDVDKFARVGAIIINTGCFFHVKNINVLNRVFNSEHTTENYRKTCIYCLNGSLDVQECAFSYGITSNPLSVQYAITLNNGFGLFFRSLDFATTEAQWNNRGDNQIFYNAYRSMVNGHNLLTKNSSIIA